MPAARCHRTGLSVVSLMSCDKLALDKSGVTTSRAASSDYTFSESVQPFQNGSESATQPMNVDKCRNTWANTSSAHTYGAQTVRKCSHLTAMTYLIRILYAAS